MPRFFCFPSASLCLQPEHFRDTPSGMVFPPAYSTLKNYKKKFHSCHQQPISPKKSPLDWGGFQRFGSGLLSRKKFAVSSAMKSLTAEFGM
ncbi:MAG: hypothetical protein LBN96_06555, partial [Desulfovibrio sp.]|nr:hypothetical protein [Desulfovibrio sp.]